MTSRSREPAEGSESRETHSASSPIWGALIGLLITARFLRPEDAQFGGTLWISAAWLVLAGLWFWNQARRGEWAWRFGVLDALVWGLAGAHLLATVGVFFEGGDRRGAVNVTWEWVGLAASLLLIRQWAGSAEIRRLVALFAAVMTALAALGIWQYHVAIPELASRYTELRQQEEALLAQSGPAARQQLAQVREELASFHVPAEEAARIQWENRLTQSTEPFATFALANTLAGLLAAALPLLAMGASRWGGRITGRNASATVFTRVTDRNVCATILLLASLAVLYCLILTKSRTAWVGLAAGMVAALGWQWARGRSLGRGALWGGGLVLIAGIGGVVAFLAGGLDRQVLTQAAMSLRYRFEYWRGTLGVLAEEPWLGTGPANFRSAYMKHRLIGASEEIAAPHNLFLEIWVAGGLLALLLLLGLLGWLAWRIIAQREEGLVAFRGDEDSGGMSGCEWGALAAFFVVAALYIPAGESFDWRLIAIAPIFLLAALAWNGARATPGMGLAVLAGLGALLVHLLGADGIEFPVVLQTILLLAIAIDGPAVRRAISPAAGWSVPLGLGGLVIGILLTAIVPVFNASALLMRARTLQQRGRPGAVRMVNAAIEADPWSLEAVITRAQLATARARAPGRAPAARREAIAAWEAVLQADPQSVAARRGIARVLMAGAREGDEPELAGRAAAVLTEAAALSPTSVAIWVSQARAHAAAGERKQAAAAAEKALALDAVNRRRGHRDLTLEEVERAELEALIDLGAEGASS